MSVGGSLILFSWCSFFWLQEIAYTRQPSRGKETEDLEAHPFPLLLRISNLPCVSFHDRERMIAQVRVYARHESNKGLRCNDVRLQQDESHAIFSG